MGGYMPWPSGESTEPLLFEGVRLLVSGESTEASRSLISSPSAALSTGGLSMLLPLPLREKVPFRSDNSDDDEEGREELDEDL
mmetsp:Transcript_83536/g.167301  ORF Transcript_83536/g.167301 Transcript_83536/m.167301 type:complete len:83 (-) Transcript_83536:184-432(-)